MSHTSELGIAIPAWMSHISVTLADNVRLNTKDSETWALSDNGPSKVFRVPKGNMSLVLSHLSQGGCPIEELIRLLDDATGPLSVTEQVSRLWRAGCLMQTVRSQEETVAVLRARGETPLIPRLIDVADCVTLTENGCMHRNGSTLMVEAIDFGAAVEVMAPEYCAVVTDLMEVTTPQQLAQRFSLPESVVTALISWLAAIGVVRLDHRFEEDQRYQRWSFADRLLHARCRVERQIGGYGSTFPLKGGPSQFPPALRPARNSTRVPLVRPDLAEIVGQDLPFTSVLEKRCSIRDHGETPLSAAELSEFLYRAARIRSTSKFGDIEYIARPFPAAGGLHELEFYVLVNRCTGILPSLYRYDGLAHELEHVSDPSADTRRLTSDAMWSAAMQTEPQILIILAARFSRINSKYESIVYSLVLKDVGVVYQTMYLVATAMNLASCALGGGSSDGFCRIAGTDYWEESSVGEFMLGKPGPEKG